MAELVPPFRSAADVAAFSAVPLNARLRGRDIIGMILEQAEENPGAVAVNYYRTANVNECAQTLTRQELVSRVAGFRELLVTAGIKRGDVVAMLLPNGPGTLAASLSVFSYAVLAPINIYLEAVQIETLLLQSGARAVLVPSQAPPELISVFDALQATCRRLGCIIIEVNHEFPEPRRVSTSSMLTSRAAADPVALFHTGGTTGLPKFVPLEARHLASCSIITQFAFGFYAADNVLCAMPMFHVGGLFACSVFPLCFGSRITIVHPLGYRGGLIPALPRILRSLNITIATGPPTVMAQLAEALPKRTDIPRLRLFVNGAAALPKRFGLQLSEATGVPVVEPWGLTESTLAVASGPRDGELKQGSVGLPLPYCAVKVMRTDAEGHPIGESATDEIGILAIRGPTVFAGYSGVAQSEQPFFPGGWLNTGDLGRIDEDGFIWVTGRAKELIKRGGHGIDPAVIEEALLAHPAVALAAAVGKPDSYAGELPVAYVQLHAGHSVEAAELMLLATQRISERAAVPKEIITVDKLPVTPIGKVHKQALKVDIVRRAAEAALTQAIGPVTPAIQVSVELDPTKGFLVRASVPQSHLDRAAQVLTAFTFASEIIPTQEEHSDA